jgi:hypothetical protein
MSDYNDIKDNEIRIIGNADQPTETLRKPFYRKWWFWVALVGLIALAVANWLLTRNINRKMAATSEVGIVEKESAPIAPTIVQAEPATVLVRDTSVNDVQMRIYTPVNAVPELCIGYPDPKDNTLVLAFQAADIRADNHEILGAFVLKGEMLSRGRSKKGFCAIIDGKIQLGMAESTPLLEEATEKEGYFFRQYPLVLEGKMVENKPKNKALRHALCEWNGSIVTVSSMEKESLHDFAQALADLGVQNAIYLVGADSYGFCRTQSNETSETVFWGEKKNDKMFEKVNFIVWRINEM